MLLNLLSNAVKFTEEGEVVVHVDAEPRRPRQRTVCTLAVRDTGIGIPQDRMDRLFESFSQVDASTTRRYGGTGLGLAISKRLVELMGGAMWVESEEGQGSTFHIELTAAEAEVPSRIDRDDGLRRARRQAHPRRRRQRHEPRDREPAGAIVGHGSRGGRASLRGARAASSRASSSTSPSLDMLMPEMDGLELARRDPAAAGRAAAAARAPHLARGDCPRRAPPTEFSAQLAKPVKASQLYNALLRVAREARGRPAAADGRHGRRACPRRRRCGSSWPRTTP